MANFYNIVPVFANHHEFAVSEIRRQHREVGLDKFLLCLSFHPQRTPARDLIPELCGAFAEIRDALYGEGVELGVLVQSILGHGWNGKVPLTREAWQHVVKVDGDEDPRFCVLDEGFREYTRELIRAVAAERPALMLLDDDVGIRCRECYCPLHLSMMSRRVGRCLSREELDGMYARRRFDDPELLAVRDVLLNSIVGYASMIRETIDSVDPAMRCGICACWSGQWEMDALVRTLAGGTKPLMRVNDAIYGDTRHGALLDDFVLASRVINHIGCGAEILDEADTFPHNYMSESATVFHAHITSAMLMGLDGCKLWTSEYGQPVHTGSQARYERRLHDYRPFYETLNGLSRTIRWKGLSLIKYIPKDGAEGNPAIDGAEVLAPGGWINKIEGYYGLPVRCERAGAEGISVLRGEEVKWMRRGDVDRLLAGRLVVDATAARLLTDMGCGDLIGVRATSGDSDFHFSFEELADGSISNAYLWEASAARLEPLSEKTEVLAWFCQGRRFVETRRAFPSATLFRNRLGGTVAVMGWSFSSSYVTTMRPLRRAMYLRVLDALGGEPFEMAVENGEQAFVRHGVLPAGGELVAVFPLGLDIDESLPLRLLRTPARVETLLPDGGWSPVPFGRRSEDVVETGVRVACAEPVILRLNF